MHSSSKFTAQDGLNFFANHLRAGVPSALGAECQAIRHTALWGPLEALSSQSRPNSAVRCASMIHTDAQHVPIIDKPGTTSIGALFFLDPQILQRCVTCHTFWRECSCSTNVLRTFVGYEQLHSRGVFWRIRGGLGDSWKRGTDNPRDLIFGRIRA